MAGKKQLRSVVAMNEIRRAHWKVLGIKDEDMSKPKIAVVNSSSELAICFSHLDGVAKVVKDAIWAAGGIPFEIRTTAPSDFLISAGHAGGYILPSRDLVVNDMEIPIQGGQLDGMICLSSCDKTPPAHMMAAGRFNIPAILVICGYQPSGEYKGKHVGIEDLFLGGVQTQFGKLSKDDLHGMAEQAIQGPGVCSGMATANSMHSICEALGMTLPGAAPVLANSPKMFEMARRSGERIVEMTLEDLKPRDILTPDAFHNAVTTLMAISGSINCIKHMQATAIEAGLDIDIYQMVNDLGAKTPVLSAVQPNGDYLIDEFDHAGGARAMLKQLEPLLKTNALTVTGRTLGDNLQGVEVTNEDVIRPLDKPFADKPPIVVLKGSLAPESAIIKLGIRDASRKTKFKGPAVVFDSGQEAIKAIEDGKIKRGDALVVRGMGLKGGPGMAGPASHVVFALDSAGMQSDVAFVSDGQLSGLCNKGLTIAETSPEAAVGGPLSLVENGDQIVIDVDEGLLDLDVPAEVLAERRKAKGDIVLPKSSGYLSIYQRAVQDMHTGAVLVEK